MSFRTRCSTVLARRWPLWLGSLALATLSACGGDTSRVQNYAPTRFVAFGDEQSLLTATGAKYTINTLNATTNLVDCSLTQNWVQAVAGAFGMVFAECNPANVAAPAALMKAAVGARVANVRSDVAAYKAANAPLTSATLVSVLVGTHDVLDAYQAYDAGTLTRDQAVAQVKTVGASLGALVNELTDNGNGARVLYVTVPDIGYSPYALAEKAAKPAVDRAQVLRDLIAEFNQAYRITVLNEGQWAGLIIADDMVGAMVKQPGLYGLANVIDAACVATAVLPACTTATLVAGTGGSSTTYLWADNFRLGVTAQTRIGSLAAYRALNNPF